MADNTITAESFRAVAKSTSFSSRDIEISKRTGNAKLGAFVVSAGTASSKAVMAEFKKALEREYGALGTHAFDTVVGLRKQMGKSLRACDVTRTFSKIAMLRKNRFVGELQRQLDTSPRVLSLPDDASRQAVVDKITRWLKKGAFLSKCKTDEDIADRADKWIAKAVEEVRLVRKQVDVGKIKSGSGAAAGAKGDEPMGLQNLKTAFGGDATSVEDKVKAGTIGKGMRINYSESHPYLFERLKEDGVEPGYICRMDWSRDDTRSLMTKWDSDKSLLALAKLKQDNVEFAAKCNMAKAVTAREQIMLAGREHPACLSAVAEFILEKAAGLVYGDRPLGDDPLSRLAKALARKFNFMEIAVLAGAEKDAGKVETKALFEKAKIELFSQIRDVVLKTRDKELIEKSPAFRYYAKLHILKLDYNEKDRVVQWSAGHSGSFQRPERYLARHSSIMRYATSASADDISTGAVSEALANDLTRLAGVPAQNLRIVRGTYSDGHPKLMLDAEFADGYSDMDKGYIKDGRIVQQEGREVESLGKYKAFYLLLADRDAIGYKGQNKGFVAGDGQAKFFAIDPGHSLEKNSADLAINDDLSFKDTAFSRHFAQRFKNYTVFDDDTRFAKIRGVLDIRDKMVSGDFNRLFDKYREEFNPRAKGISPAEKALREKIIGEIDKKQAEFTESLGRLLNICSAQIKLYDDLAKDGAEMQKGAIETIANLEKLTSPTTWVSKKGKVLLKHLEVRRDTRVPWTAAVEGDNIVYTCGKKLPPALSGNLSRFLANCGARLDNDGRTTRIVVPKRAAAAVFEKTSEENVMMYTHMEEYVARKGGEIDPYAVAKDYVPAT